MRSISQGVPHRLLAGIAAVNLAVLGAAAFASWRSQTTLIAVLALFGVVSGSGALLWYAAWKRQLATSLALEDERLKFKSLFETANDGVFFLDDSGLVDCNRRGAALFGITPRQMVGLSLVQLSPEQQPDGRDSQSLATELLARAKAGESLLFPWRCRHHDGALFDTEISLSRIESGDSVLLQAHVRDTTERCRAEQELHNSREALRTLIEALPDAIQFKDHQGRWLAYNRNAQAAFGLERVDCTGKDDRELAELAPAPFRESLLCCRATDEAAWQAGSLSQLEETVTRADGAALVFAVTKVPLFHPDGSRKGLVIAARDVTAAKRAEARLRLAASVFEHSHEGICITDGQERIIEVNPAFCELTGFDREAILGQTPRIMKSGLQDRAFYAAMWQAIAEWGHWQGELWNRRPDGELYAERLTISAVCDTCGQPSHYVGVQSDVTAAKRYQEQLERIAHYDPLTGIPNRALLADRMRQAIAHSRRAGTLLAVCYLDLDGFKPINDRYGHEAGDRLLIEIAGRLERCLRGGDTVARLGGDEFVLLFAGIAQPRECLMAIERALDTVARPVELDGRPVTLSASIGVTLFPEDDATPDTLLRHADQAMYRAKQEGRNRYRLFEPRGVVTG
jgi:diguanylate cyclase (GGDEF)-like protein/PAS domain S-box-containing protein